MTRFQLAPSYFERAEWVSSNRPTFASPFPLFGTLANERWWQVHRPFSNLLYFASPMLYDSMKTQFISPVTGKWCKKTITIIDFRHIQYPFHLRFAMVKRTMQHGSCLTRWEYPLLCYNEKSLKKTMQTLLKLWFQTNVTHSSVKPAPPHWWHARLSRERRNGAK